MSVPKPKYTIGQIVFIAVDDFKHNYREGSDIQDYIMQLQVKNFQYMRRYTDAEWRVEYNFYDNIKTISEEEIFGSMEEARNSIMKKLEDYYQKKVAEYELDIQKLEECAVEAQKILLSLNMQEKIYNIIKGIEYIKCM